MPMIKTSELTGAALDWAVAECEDHDFPAADAFCGIFNPSTDWAQGGPIIAREGISIAKLEETLPDAIAPHPTCWSGHIDGIYVRYGPTPLIAAMRCYCASTLGADVDVPEELTK